jgi:hypothetical protein
MKKIIFSIILCCCLAGLACMNVVAQNVDCIALDSSQNRLYLNGDNLTLIDNALRCFQLTSVAKVQDSLVRVWTLETDYPDTPTIRRVKMFEFGKRGNVPHATLYILEWTRENDNSLPVKCIKQIQIPPNNGWLAFEKDIRRLNLLKLYQKPFINRGEVVVDAGMLVLQFLFGHSTHTVDFTGLVGTFNKANTLWVEHSKRIELLFFYLEKHFSVQLSFFRTHRASF